MQELRRSKDYLHDRPKPTGIDVVYGLKHFSIITYVVPADRFKNIFPDRFKLDIIKMDGEEQVLISVAPFIDIDFISAVYSFTTFTMGQIHYRIYIIDTETGNRCVWFLGTTLDSWTLAVPRYLWSLPCHSTKMIFYCHFYDAAGRYIKYSVNAESE